MAKHIIRPFVISLIPCDKSTFTYLNNIGEQLMTPIIAWVIEAPDEKILVDTGISAEMCTKYRSNPEVGTPFESALKGVG